LAVALLSVSTACASVPSGSEPVAVRHVDPSDVAGPPVDIQVVPPGPTKHMSSRDVVNGFLQASSYGVDVRHQVARGFLTPKAAATWQDTAQSIVYNQPLLDDQAGGVVKVSAHQIATVTRDGAYQSQVGQVVVHFSLTKVKGEWRIENPPPGIYVRQSDFTQNFHSADVYFLNSSGTAVVPDPRYFEVPTTAMANRLLQALIGGPSQWLMPAVTTDIPKNASLRTNVVDDSPTVAVDLNHLDTANLGRSQLRGMSAQIVFTLAKYNSSSVRILNEGQPLAVPGVGTVQQESDWQSYDPEALPAEAPLYFVQQGSAWSGAGKAVRGYAGKNYYKLNSVAVPLDGKKMAGISHRKTTDRLFVGPMGGTLADRFDAQQLTTPTWGAQSSEVWTVRDGTDVIRVPLAAEAQAQVVASPEVSRVAPVSELKLSRDGTRVALIGKGGRLYLARVSRTANSLIIDGLRPLTTQTRFTDVTWASGDDLVGLAPNSTGTRTPWDISVDGSSRQAEGIDNLPAQPDSVAAASDRLTVVSSKNELWYYDRATWSKVTASGNSITLHGTAPAYPD
jgi:hypothetical protein